MLSWALMADKFDMHELCGHCERAMMMHWSHFDDKAKLGDQRSSSALLRIAKGLNQTMLSSTGYSYCNVPDVHEFIARRPQKQTTVHDDIYDHDDQDDYDSD